MSGSSSEHNPKSGGDRFSDAAFKVLGRSLARLEHIDSSSWRGEVELRGLSLRVPKERGGEWLVVMRGFDHEGGPVVAFHSALMGSEAISGAIERMVNGTLKWKTDEYYR